jgi:aminopeptidase N
VYPPLIDNLTPAVEKSSLFIVNDTTYDVHFYHIDVEVGINSPYIGGKVSYLLQSQKDELQQITMDFKDYYIIDSISTPVSSFSLSNDVLQLVFGTPFAMDEMIEFTIHYHGIPQLEGGYKGLRYETHNGNEPVIATLSTPFLAHTWFPCKDGTTDKADSVFVDITIPTISYSNIPLIALSNGLLTNVQELGDKRQFSWQHHYPIVPYYVMIAISNYSTFQQVFEGNGYSFPVDYYVFEEHLATAQSAMNTFPDAIDFFTEIFGDYPFRDEKYGMTQLGYYGAIENQTNTIINSLSSSYFNTAVHELAHQWFGDMITCADWHHGWLNEGFATYAAVLYQEHLYGPQVYANAMEDLEYYSEGTVYLQDDTDPFNIFVAIIYYKGAYVLHMLRGIMGDEAFFAAIHSYASDTNFSFGNATTEDFQSVCEEFYSGSLDNFFDQWIYDEYFPVYHYNFEYNASTHELGLAIFQIQSMQGWRPVFEMPMEIQVQFSDGSDSLLLINNYEQLQSYYFTMEKEVSNVSLDPNHRILKEAEQDDNINIGISTMNKQITMLYPNPNDGVFIIDAGNTDITHVSVSSINGQNILNRSYYPNDGKILVRLPNSQKGMYIVKISSKQTTTYHKIVLR